MHSQSMLIYASNTTKIGVYGGIPPNIHRATALDTITPIGQVIRGRQEYSDVI